MYVYLLMIMASRLVYYTVRRIEITTNTDYPKPFNKDEKIITTIALDRMTIQFKLINHAMSLGHVVIPWKLSMYVNATHIG